MWKLTLVDLNIRVGILLLNNVGGYYIYTEFIPGYFPANLAGNLQYYYLTIFVLEDVIIFYSILDGFSYSSLAQLLENRRIRSIQSRVKDINVIQMKYIYLILPWNNYLVLVC